MLLYVIFIYILLGIISKDDEGPNAHEFFFISLLLDVIFILYLGIISKDDEGPDIRMKSPPASPPVSPPRFELGGASRVTGGILRG